MHQPEIIESVKKFDKGAMKTVFQAYYGRFAAIAERYSKNASQAQELILAGFTAAFRKLAGTKQVGGIDLSSFMEKEFIHECIRSVRSFRSEYYVASTVYATAPSCDDRATGEDEVQHDYKSLPGQVLVKAIQQLVPSQRLVFNLCVVDNYSIEETAALLETSEPTVKSNLEKARYHLQKHIDKLLKTQKS